MELPPRKLVVREKGVPNDAIRREEYAVKSRASNGLKEGTLRHSTQPLRHLSDIHLS